jgi:hypothetical protein
MKTTSPFAAILAAVALLLAGHAHAQDLMLLPFELTPILDGDAQWDETGGVTDTIVIDPSNPLPLPNNPGLVFSGMVEYLPTGSFTIGGVPGIRGIKITGIPAGSGLPGAGQPATITNTTASTITMTDPVTLAAYNYTSLDPSGLPGSGDLSIEIFGHLDTTPTPGGSIPNTLQRIELEARASSFTLNSTGTPNDPVAAAWSNPHPTMNGPLGVGAQYDEPGTFDDSFGRVSITISNLTLGPNERYEFPASIVVGVVPEPSSLALLSAAGLLMLRRRR